MEKYGIINIDINTCTVGGTRIIEEIRVGDNELVYLYGADGSPVGMRYNDIPYYYGKNLFGDIVDIYDANGNKVAHYIYDAWGYHKILDADGNNVTFVTTHIGYINPIRYRGYYFDVETELYYLQTRYYDPVTGRFLNADALAYLGADGELRGYNLYTYCGNNPVMYVDPTGRGFFTVLFIVAAALIVGGGIYGGIYAAINDQDVFKGVLNGLWTGALLAANIALLAISIKYGFVGFLTKNAFQKFFIVANQIVTIFSNGVGIYSYIQSTTQNNEDLWLNLPDFLSDSLIENAYSVAPIIGGASGLSWGKAIGASAALMAGTYTAHYFAHSHAKGDNISGGDVIANIIYGSMAGAFTGGSALAAGRLHWALQTLIEKLAEGSVYGA